MAEHLSEDNTMNENVEKDTYLKIRQSYDEAELEVSGRYDKWILTLSGGALGLSITFIEKIAQNPTPGALSWLKCSWGCLVISLLAALLSLVTSQSAIRENRKELDLAHSEKRAPSLSFPRWFTNITNGLNWGSLSLFIFGVIFLCIFSFKNIDQRNVNGESDHGKKTTQTTSKTASEGKDGRRIRTITTTTAAEEGAGIRSTTSPTEKGQDKMNNTGADAVLKKNHDSKSTTDK